MTLDGSASTQAQSHVISYAWSQTGGPAVTLSSTTAAEADVHRPADRRDRDHATRSRLTVTDTQSPITGTGTNGNTSTAATTTVTSVARPRGRERRTEPDRQGRGQPDHARRLGVDRPELRAADLHVDAGEQRRTDGHAVETRTRRSPTFTAPPAAAAAGYTAQFNVTATNGGPNPADTDTTITPVSITVAASTPTATVDPHAERHRVHG